MPKLYQKDYDIGMNPSQPPRPSGDSPKPPPGVWPSILLLIIFVCFIVTLFSGLIYLFVGGAERLAWPAWAYVVILVVISGIFAWLVKRLTDSVAGLSHYWFPEDSDREN